LSRGGIDYEGIGFRSATYKASDALVSAVLVAKAWENDGRSAVLDKAVTITGNYEAGFGNAGDPLLGRIHQYEFDGYMTVQEGGYTEFDGVSGNLPNAGDYVVVNGSGAVMPSVGAIGPARAVSVDPDNIKVMVLIA
jgi:hypothetical protein